MEGSPERRDPVREPAHSAGHVPDLGPLVPLRPVEACEYRLREGARPPGPQCHDRLAAPGHGGHGDGGGPELLGPLGDAHPYIWEGWVDAA